MNKKICAILLSSLMAISMVGCGNKVDKVENGNGQNVESQSDVKLSVSAKEIVDAVVEKGFVRMPLEVDDTIAQDRYFVDLDVVEEYAIAETQITPGPGVIVVLKAKDGKIEETKAILEKIKTANVDKAFYPEEQEAAKNSKVEFVGNIGYYALFNSEVTEEAQKTIADMLK